ncbi:hypothetical protein [Hymenobacter sp. CRA2]|uniref:hypothetical protein n=1 Tax=Hymenobacter sp. CRA2 TaxID=1955620 RepID=UPI00098F542D|nr:hypothetical protein [Hymenobacter sp. CRA2]OON66906.1 hypothetical protein B0919_20165 [Hymenobacter sp. CRA2]
MNFELITEIESYLSRKQLTEAIALCETRLRALPETDFHAMLGCTMLAQTQDATAWLEALYQKVVQAQPVAVLYAELNGFAFNTDEWYADGIAYPQRGPLDDLDWLGEWHRGMASAEPLVIHDMEALQEAFEEHFDLDDEDAPLEAARDLTYMLVILRFQELMAQAHAAAKAQGLPWAALPVLATAHGHDFVYESA